MKKTNVWDSIVILLIIGYMLTAFGGAAYLVHSCGWSAWWMLFPAVFMGIEFKAEKNEEP